MPIHFALPVSDEQVEHFAVEFVSFEIFEFAIGATGIEDTKGSVEIPHRPSEVIPAPLPPDGNAWFR